MDNNKFSEEDFEKLKKVLADKSAENKYMPKPLPSETKQKTKEKTINDHLLDVKIAIQSLTPLNIPIPRLRLPEYRFSKNLKSEELTRVEINDWKYSANFLVNFCNTFSTSKTEDDEVKSLMSNSFLLDTIDLLHTREITNTTFEEIYLKNKPLFSFTSTPNSLLRKNFLFLIVYTKGVQQKFKQNDLDIERLAKYWIKYLITHSQFSNLKACRFLNKHYNKHIDSNKLSTIKYFNEIILGQLEIQFADQKLNFEWLKSLGRTYRRLFSEAYSKCEPIPITAFTFFSQDELDLVFYTIQYTTTTSNDFPYIFQDLIVNLLLEEGFNSKIIEMLGSDLEALDKP